MKLTFQRAQLYEEVWSTPMTHLAENYGVSNYQLSKICTELDIPTPPSVYWSKIRHGKKLKQPQLLESDQTIFELYTQKNFDIDLSEKLPKPLKPITVKKTLSNPHHLVKDTYNRLKDRWVNYNKRVQAIGKGYLDVSVNPDSLKRALRILDALLKAVTRQEFKIGTDRISRFSKSYFQVEDEKIFFQLREEGYRQKRDPKKSEPNQRWSSSEYEYFTTGRLKLYLCESIHCLNRKTISDTNTKTLEERLDEFFPLLLDMAEKVKIERLEREERHRQWEEEWRLRREAEQQHQKENERLEVLEKQAEAFTKSQYIYDFINQIEAAGKGLNLTEKEKLFLKGWLYWASIHADRLNPVKGTLKSILDSPEEPTKEQNF